MATRHHIPYNPQSDPKQYMAQALQQFGQSSLATRQKQQFDKGLSPTMTPMQVMQHALKTGYDPQTAVRMASVAPSEYEKARTASLGQPSPETVTQLKAKEIRRLQLKKESGTITKAETAKLDKMLVGSPLVEVSMGKPASATERKAIADTRASIDALDNLKTLFDNKETKSGVIAGRMEPIKGLFGMTSDEQESFMAATSAFKNRIIKEITGAQMSEVEAKRIMKQVPDITDPPARWKAKWKESKKNLDFLQKRRLEILQQSGLRTPAPTRETLSPEDLENLTIEELQSL